MDDTACSTFPSDRTQGIKTVSNSESARQEGVGQWGLCVLFLHWILQTRSDSRLIMDITTVCRENLNVVNGTLRLLGTEAL